MAKPTFVDDPACALAEGVAAMAIVKWLLRREFIRSKYSRELVKELDALAIQWATGRSPRFREAENPAFRMAVAHHIRAAARGGDISAAEDPFYPKAQEAADLTAKLLSTGPRYNRRAYRLISEALALCLPPD